MHERIAQEVGEHLRELMGIAGHDHRLGDVELDRTLGRRCVGVLDRVAHERREIDGARAQLARLIEPGQREQLFDEHAHAP